MAASTVSAAGRAWLHWLHVSAFFFPRPIKRPGLALASPVEQAQDLAQSLRIHEACQRFHVRDSWQSPIDPVFALAGGTFVPAQAFDVLGQ